MPKVLKIIGIIVVVLVALLLLAFVVAAAVPAEKDPPVDMANHGAGSTSVEPAYGRPSWAGCCSSIPSCQRPTTSPAPRATIPTSASATAGRRPWV